MLEAYSTNLTLVADQAIPLNNVTIQKGCTAVLSAPATIQLNKCGVYMISCNMSATSTNAGDVSIQLSKNGIPQPQAIATESVEAAGTANLAFTTLVQVTSNNSNCPCASPTLIQIINDAAVTEANVNVVVTKIC